MAYWFQSLEGNIKEEELVGSFAWISDVCWCLAGFMEIAKAIGHFILFEDDSMIANNS